MNFSDIRDLGNRVLALGTLRVTGMGSGIEIEVPLAILASFRGGLITQLNDYGDKDRASKLPVCGNSQRHPPWTRAQLSPRARSGGAAEGTRGTESGS